jgi:hypothetical protein
MREDSVREGKEQGGLKDKVCATVSLDFRFRVSCVDESYLAQVTGRILCT